MSLENTPKLTTILSIGGHQVHPEELTALVGVEPTKVWKQQHQWIESIRPDINTIEWSYALENQRKWNLGEAIEEVLNVFWSKKDELNLLLLNTQSKMHIDCRPFGDASTIEYILQPEVITKLAFFRASLSFAVYKEEL